MFDKVRLLDLIRTFIIFDGGQKKVPRVHQYHGVKAAQERVKQQEGGVIWHTQGSGKSILMVLITKRLLEFDLHARVLVITDRDELDKQIVGVMRNVGVIGEDAASPRLMCALIHKLDTTYDRPEGRASEGGLYTSSSMNVTAHKTAT